MPGSASGPPTRPRRRLAAVVGAFALTGALSLGAPSSASAYEQHFCQNVWLASTAVCTAADVHTLQTVTAWSLSGPYRVCAASYTWQWGTQNSDWRCDYTAAVKSLGGRVVGVGAIRNGATVGIVGYGVQEF